MTNTQKVIFLLKNLSGNQYHKSIYKIRDNKVYAASWEDNRQGDISDYKETFVEDDKLAGLVQKLEEDFCKQEINKELETKKKQIIKTLYES